MPIRPGTDGALALGLIQVLLEEELYDEEFARDWTVGFAELQQYVQHFRPEVGGTDHRHAGRDRALAGPADRRGPRGLPGHVHRSRIFRQRRAGDPRRLHPLGPGRPARCPRRPALPDEGEYLPAEPQRADRQSRPRNAPSAATAFPSTPNTAASPTPSPCRDAVLDGEPYRIRALIVLGGSIMHLLAQPRALATDPGGPGFSGLHRPLSHRRLGLCRSGPAGHHLFRDHLLHALRAAVQDPREAGRTGAGRGAQRLSDPGRAGPAAGLRPSLPAERGGDAAPGPGGQRFYPGRGAGATAAACRCRR